jgi:carbon monoxide dehydrogenase subunit G
VIEVEHSIELAVPIDTVWDYVQDMANWAPFVIGYQDLRIVDERTSIWTVRGDVGMLARVVDLRVEITDWRPGEAVEFTLAGVTERLDGSGSVVLSVWDPAAPAVGAEGAADGSAPRRRWWGARILARLRRRIARAVLRRIDRRRRAAVGTPPGATTPASPRPASGPAPVGGESSAGPAGTRMSFELRLTPGGPMAPMFELLMAPLLEPAAEDLAAGIRGVLEP